MDIGRRPTQPQPGPPAQPQQRPPAQPPQPAQTTDIAGGASAPGRTESLATVMERLELRDHPAAPATPRTIYCTCSGQPMARLAVLWNGQTVKAACKQHFKCALMVQASWYPQSDEALRVAYRWSAMAKYCTREEHVDEVASILTHFVDPPIPRPRLHPLGVLLQRTCVVCERVLAGTHLCARAPHVVYESVQCVYLYILYFTIISVMSTHPCPRTHVYIHLYIYIYIYIHVYQIKQ